MAEHDLPREAFGDPAHADVFWVTLFSGDRTPTDRLTAGLMQIEPGGSGLAPHRHAQPEIYHVVSGSGLLTVSGLERPISAGMSAYIPGNAEHALRATGTAPLRVFYVFPCDRFSDVVYRFPPCPDDP